MEAGAGASAWNVQGMGSFPRTAQSRVETVLCSHKVLIYFPENFMQESNVSRSYSSSTPSLPPSPHHTPPNISSTSLPASWFLFFQSSISPISAAHMHVGMESNTEAGAFYQWLSSSPEKGTLFPSIQQLPGAPVSEVGNPAGIFNSLILWRSPPASYWDQKCYCLWKWGIITVPTDPSRLH